MVSNSTMNQSQSFVSLIAILSIYNYTVSMLIVCRIRYQVKLLVIDHNQIDF